MKNRIKKLGTYQKAVLILVLVLAVVFSVIYPITIRQVGFAYRGSLLTPSQEGGSQVYAGTVNGERALFTVSPDKAVTFQYGETSYGPYTVTEDPDALPEEGASGWDLGGGAPTGIVLRDGEDVVFQGGVVQQGASYWLYHQDGRVETEGVTISAQEGVTLDENGQPIDPNKPSVAAILSLVEGPSLTHKGSWLPYLLGLFLCVATAVTILFADELFRFQLWFQIRSPERAEPSDWELFSRYAAWTALPLAALVVFLLGLR